MILYAESSAILTWLLTQESAADVAGALSEAEIIVSSDLTLLECERVLVRGISADELSEGEVTKRQMILRTAARHWMLLSFTPAVIERAGRPYPLEPLRTLDALHLSFALEARRILPAVRLLSLDRRIRETARQIGLPLMPLAGVP